MTVADRVRRLAQKARAAGAEHPDQLAKAVDAAEKLADKRTDGKYHDQIQNAGGKADAYIETLSVDTRSDEATTGASSTPPPDPPDDARP